MHIHFNMSKINTLQHRLQVYHKKNNTVQIFKTAMLIVSLIVGAGFASGSELVSFFGKFGFAAYPVAVLCGLMLFCSLIVFMSLGEIIRPKSTEDLTRALFGKFSPVADTFILFIHLIITASMVAGADQLIEFGSIQMPIISLLTLCLVYVVVYRGFQSLVDVNAFLMPLVLFTCFLVGVYGITHPVDFVASQGTLAEVLGSAFIYVGMNTLLSATVITSINQPLKLQVKSAGIGSIIISCLIMLLTSAIMCGGIAVISADMPIMVLASRMNAKLVFVIVLWSAIFSSVLANSYILNQWASGLIKDKQISLSTVLIVVFILSRLGFKTIVDIFYPLCSAAGAIFVLSGVIYLIRHSLKNRFSDKAKPLNHETSNKISLP